MAEPDSSFESLHVHAVYNTIATDFSRTRHSRWPFVQSFLDELPSGSVILDAGCGNGKYLGCNSVLPWDGDRSRAGGAWPAQAASDKGKGKGKGKSTSGTRAGKPNTGGKATALPVDPPREVEVDVSRLFLVGLDMSQGLLSIAHNKGHEVVRGDCFDLSCWRRGAFDHAISIATIHHFASPSRRLESVKQLILAVLPPHPSRTPSTSSSPTRQAKILIVVWALEQDPALAGTGSARRGKKGAVPVRFRSSEAAAGGEGDRAVGSRTGEEDRAGMKEEDRDDDLDEQDVFVPWELQAPPPPKAPNPLSLPKALRPAVALLPPPRPPPDAPKVTYNRYYHLFKRRELSGLVWLAARELGGTFVDSSESGWDGEDGQVSAENVLGGKGATTVEERPLDGESDWVLEVELMSEVWERENWVGRVGVRWVLRTGQVESTPQP